MKKSRYCVLLGIIVVLLLICCNAYARPMAGDAMRDSKEIMEKVC